MLREDAENGVGAWSAQGPWAISDEAAASPSHAWSDSPGADYDDSTNAALTSPVLNLAGLVAVELRLVQRLDLEAGFDFALVEVSTDDGTTWTESASFSVAEQTSFEPIVIALPELAGAPTARVRFRLTSDDILSFDGWHIDDIVISGIDSAALAIFADDFETGDTSAWALTVP